MSSEVDITVQPKVDEVPEIVNDETTVKKRTKKNNAPNRYGFLRISDFLSISNGATYYSGQQARIDTQLAQKRSNLFVGNQLKSDEVVNPIKYPTIMDSFDKITNKTEEFLKIKDVFNGEISEEKYKKFKKDVEDSFKDSLSGKEKKEFYQLLFEKTIEIKESGSSNKIYNDKYRELITTLFKDQFKDGAFKRQAIDNALKFNKIDDDKTYVEKDIIDTPILEKITNFAWETTKDVLVATGNILVSGVIGATTFFYTGGDVILSTAAPTAALSLLTYAHYLVLAEEEENEERKNLTEKILKLAKENGVTDITDEYLNDPSNFKKVLDEYRSKLLLIWGCLNSTYNDVDEWGMKKLFWVNQWIASGDFDRYISSISFNVMIKDNKTKYYPMILENYNRADNMNLFGDDDILLFDTKNYFYAPGAEAGSPVIWKIPRGEDSYLKKKSKGLQTDLFMTVWTSILKQFPQITLKGGKYAKMVDKKPVIQTEPTKLDSVMNIKIITRHSNLLFIQDAEKKKQEFKKDGEQMGTEAKLQSADFVKIKKNLEPTYQYIHDIYLFADEYNGQQKKISKKMDELYNSPLEVKIPGTEKKFMFASDNAAINKLPSENEMTNKKQIDSKSKKTPEEKTEKIVNIYKFYGDNVMNVIGTDNKDLSFKVDQKKEGGILEKTVKSISEFINTSPKLAVGLGGGVLMLAALAWTGNLSIISTPIGYAGSIFKSLMTTVFEITKSILSTTGSLFTKKEVLDVVSSTTAETQKIFYGAYPLNMAPYAGPLSPPSETTILTSLQESILSNFTSDSTYRKVFDIVYKGVVNGLNTINISKGISVPGFMSTQIFGIYKDLYTTPLGVNSKFVETKPVKLIKQPETKKIIEHKEKKDIVEKPPMENVKESSKELTIEINDNTTTKEQFSESVIVEKDKQKPKKIRERVTKIMKKINDAEKQQINEMINQTNKIELNDQKETNESILRTNKLDVNTNTNTTPTPKEILEMGTTDSINEINNIDDIKIESDKVNESVENSVEEIQIPINNKFSKRSKTSEVIEIAPVDDDEEFIIDEYNDEYENQYSDYGDDDYQE